MNSFKQFEFIPQIHRTLEGMGFNKPTPIQEQSIPAAMDGRDVLGCAQTGTGKTAAFALPILNHLALKKQKAARKRPQCLILAPTRELAKQVQKQLFRFTKYTDRIFSEVVCGGDKIE